jgi:hypothetical protein
MALIEPQLANSRRERIAQSEDGGVNFRGSRASPRVPEAGRVGSLRFMGPREHFHSLESR